jgi:uncharacterized protein
MKRDEALRRLRAHEAELRAAGVAALFLFGSTARDEAGPDSDVDLFMDAADDERFSLFDFLDVKYRITHVLDQQADLLTRKGIKPRLYERILPESVKVF